MVIESNKAFINVYNKVQVKLEKKTLMYSRLRKYGGKIPIKELKILLLYVKYLESIDKSKYEYEHVLGLTNISNHLNKL